MAEYPLLKDMLDRRLVEQIAQRIATVHPPFPQDEFVAAIDGQLSALELKARTKLIAENLRQFLPSDYVQALHILLAILDAERGFEKIDNAGLRLQAIPTFVERYGLDHPTESLAAMPIITRVSSCEFAIRPFILRYPAETFACLKLWAHAEDEHTRRLVSEGSRPRLPWAPQLTQFIADPTPTLELLEMLKDDESLYVRRSVANHLNDISKDHPEIALERLASWQLDAGAGRRWLIKHALRGLLKQGDRRALAILGYGLAQVELRGLKLESTTLQFGEALRFSFELRSGSDRAQKLMVDYVLHFVKANGKTAPKVFKLKTLNLPAGESARIEKAQPIRPISSRRYYPGQQRLEIQVNGQILGGVDFALVMD